MLVLSAMINHHFRKQFLCSVQLYQMQPMGVTAKQKTMHLAFSGWYRNTSGFGMMPSPSYPLPPPLNVGGGWGRQLRKCSVAVLVFPIEGLCRSSQRLHPAHNVF